MAGIFWWVIGLFTVGIAFELFRGNSLDQVAHGIGETVIGLIVIAALGGLIEFARRAYIDSRRPRDPGA